MTIIRTISRLILQKSSASSPPRWLCTVAEKPKAATKAKKKNSLFNRVTKANSKSTVAEILNEWVNKGKQVKKVDIVNLHIYFRRRKNFHAALQLYDWMESSKFEINNADRAVRINLLCKTEGVASAEKYFDNLQASEKTNKTYGALLGCYCMEKVVDKALEIFEEMKALNHTSSLNYNNIMSLYYGIQQPEKAISLAQEMEEKNIAADLYTYNLLINSHVAVKNLDAIEEVLEKMRSNNVEYDLFTVGNLANVYLKFGLHEKANAFLEMMEEMKTEPGEDLSEACRTRMRLYSEMNDLSGVNRAWDALKLIYPTPNNTSYLFMLMALSKLGDLENLEKLFKEWEGGCSSFDFRVPNVLLEYYLSRNMMEKATSFYESLTNKETTPNLRALNLFATLCIKNCQIDSAMKYLEMGLDADGRNNNWFPTDETIKLLLNYIEENNGPDRAEKFIERMKKLNRLDSNSLLVSSNAPEVVSEDPI